MTLFAPDLYRNFAIGFGIGALGLGIAHTADGGDTFESPAHAATVIEAPEPAADFVIEPLEIAR